jgi:hypothetical protein
MTLWFWRPAKTIRIFHGLLSPFSTGVSILVVFVSMAVWGGEFWVIPQLRDFALDALLERTPVQIRSGHGVLGVYKFLGFFRIWVFQPSVGVRNLKKKNAY